MSSFDKTVKLACKPKPAPPKAKYLDPIIAATYSEDGTVHDVCKALAPRLREPNAVVVFKALIVLHTMIRNGATDNVLTYLSSEDVLKLRSVSTGHWAGYEAPKNMQNYALYLEARIRTYRDLKHDPIRVQSDANRDHRVESEIEATRGTNTKKSNGPQRSKTIMGRKLRSMTVEKGLLRETKAVQKTIDALLECRFFLDNLEDELNVTSLRFLVKDLIVLFQALNEGVINVLEHYFEMSHIDAEAALGIYRKFCKETEMVVEYLGIARKLQNLLNVPIPNLKHAPVSLVKALEEYLSDPNFEQNRIEYRAAKLSADKNNKDGAKMPSRNEATTSKNGVTPANKASSSSEPAKSNDNNQALVDFFSSIEEEQSSMFNSPSANQVQQLPSQQNPFAAQQQMMMTGAFPQVQQQFGLASQMTGFAPTVPAMFGPPAGPQNQQQHSSHPSFASFLHPQSTGFPGALQPQATGVNPFRQSMMLPQATGMTPFGPGIPTGPTFVQNSVLPIATPSFQPYPVHSASAGPEPSIFPRPSMPSEASNVPQAPARPASTPANSVANMVKPLVTHQTGSRNPFGVPVESPPPVPKAPTLQELATGNFNAGSHMFATPSQPISSPQVSTPTGAAGLSFGENRQTQQPNTNGSSAMSSIVSSFTMGRPSVDGDKPKTDVTGTSSFTSKSTFSSNLFSQPTGSTVATTNTSILSSPLQPQTTGFSGLKAFKPTSSFGASLFESLPPIPQSNATSTGSDLFTSASTQSSVTTSSQPSPPQNNATSLGFSSNPSSSATASAPGPTTQGNQPFSLSQNQPFSTGTPNFNPSSSGAIPPSFATQNTASPSFSLGVGLRPQMTGGVANPFRASMYSPPTTNIGSSPFPAFSAAQFGTLNSQSTPGASAFGGMPHNATSVDASKQQSGVASLL